MLSRCLKTMSAAETKAAAITGDGYPIRLRRSGMDAAEIMDAREMISHRKTTTTKRERAARQETGDTAK